MLFHILGSCSGTEPYAGCHHTSVALETGEKLYFLDAGENCGYSSYLAGIDQIKTDSIFISHTHMDHIGGLPHLLWNIRKLCHVDAKNIERMANRKIRVFLPNLESFDGVWKLLKGSEGGYEINFTVEPRMITDGVLLDEDIKLTAFHNLHLGEPSNGEPWRSFSFVLETEGKKALYSGDFRELSELLPYLDGSDLVFLETGHHRAFSLCEELKSSGLRFGKVVFYHHGLEILHDFDAELRLAKEVLGDRVIFARDGMKIEL